MRTRPTDLGDYGGGSTGGCAEDEHVGVTAALIVRKYTKVAVLFRD